jgi:hypothetical protein
MSAERFFQVCSAISSFIIFGCIIFMIIGIFKAPSLESLVGMDDSGEDYDGEFAEGDDGYVEGDNIQEVSQ